MNSGKDDYSRVNSGYSVFLLGSIEAKVVHTLYGEQGLGCSLYSGCSKGVSSIQDE